MKKALLAALSWVKGLFTRNIGMKVGALVFAFLLWSFVLAEQNPPKEKIFGNVYVSYATSEALRAKGLTSAQPFSEILGCGDGGGERERAFVYHGGNDHG